MKSRRLLTGTAALARVLALLALAGCSTSLGGARAIAPSCAGACLAGRDPYDAGCAAGATTKARAPVLDAGREVAMVELRESARCATRWARAIRTPGARGTLVATVRADAGASTFEHASDGEVWTDMVPIAGGARGCAIASAAIRRDDGRVLRAATSACPNPTVVDVASR